MTKRALGPRNLLFPMPAVLVGTYGADGVPDAMTAAWAAICCMKPPCAGVAVRKSRLTFENIRARRAFTLNVPAASDAVAVDYLGIVSGRREPDKVERSGLGVEAASKVDAPALTRCPLTVECELVEALPLGSHTWLVGEIVEVLVDEDALTPEGTIDVERLDPIVYSTSEQRYRRLGSAVAKAFEAGRALKR